MWRRSSFGVHRGNADGAVAGCSRDNRHTSGGFPPIDRPLLSPSKHAFCDGQVCSNEDQRDGDRSAEFCDLRQRGELAYRGAVVPREKQRIDELARGKREREGKPGRPTASFGSYAEQSSEADASRLV